MEIRRPEPNGLHRRLDRAEDEALSVDVRLDRRADSARRGRLVNSVLRCSWYLVTRCLSEIRAVHEGRGAATVRF